MSHRLIPLSIGDPTKFGNMDTDRAVSGAILSSVHAGLFNGYPPSDGFVESRQAVADFYATATGLSLVADDVSLTSGCSHALQMAIEVGALRSPRGGEGATLWSGPGPPHTAAWSRRDI
jgi:tyrosine aminotransferase